jgi:hypothetical protein
MERRAGSLRPLDYKREPKRPGFLKRLSNIALRSVLSQGLLLTRS